MSEYQSFKIPAHPSIYSCNPHNRELRIDFSIPENGVDSSTGLLILVPGFNASIDSKVYTKMRELFADQYNMITIQCDYFGSKYMQETKNFIMKDSHVIQTTFTKSEIEEINQNSSILFDLLKEKSVVFPVIANINETVEEFNDMGYMQAIDIITAIETVKAILKDNDLKYDCHRLIGYGHSQGAYLLHLSNVLAPKLFSYIVDNSGWIEPVYLTDNRYLYYEVGKATICVEFNYLARKLIKNKKDLNLKELYKNYSEKTQIISFQGDNDSFIDFNEKSYIINRINNSKLILVTEKEIDNKKYKSNTHGLGADFLELFSYAMEYEIPNREKCEIETSYALDFQGVRINVDNTCGLPVFKFDFK